MNNHELGARTLESAIENLPDEKSIETAEIMRRFNDVFQRHDPSELNNLIAENCVIEKITPGPDGDRWIGRDACIENWKAIATEPGAHFDLEETFAAGDRAIIRWCFWSSEGRSTRGVNLMRVRDGLIVEAMGYIKGG
ncbi:MAG: nuclear transport factor 2 family protein [Chthoniobacterales bacterium]